MGKFIRRLRFLIRRRQFERELEEEMRCHREMMAEEKIEQGCDPVEARRLAAVRFGNATALKETSGEAWGWGSLDRLDQDLRFAIRMARKDPWLTAVIVAVLALGIGANTATFSALDAALLRPFPFPDSERLVMVDARHVSGNNSGAGYQDFRDWRAQNSVFEDMAIFPWTGGYTLTGEGEPRRVTATATTAGFDRVLRFRPALGRFFTAAEDTPGGPQVVLVSYEMWRDRYGRDPNAIGRSVVLDGRPRTIIGVMPERFSMRGVRSCDFWKPLQSDRTISRMQHQYGVIARLRPGVSMAGAQANMTAIARALELSYPETNTGWRIDVSSVRSLVMEIGGRPLLVLVLAVFSVLLLACANVAGMLLSRASARSTEMSVRASLGAGRWRIARQVLTESVVLSVAAGGLGVVLAGWMLSVLRKAAPEDLGLESALRLDWRALAVALALSLATGIAFGAAPAWYASRTELAMTLNSTGARSGFRSRRGVLPFIVSGEIAISMVLLVAASLLTKDLRVLLRTELGVKIDHVLTFALDLPAVKYPQETRAVRFYDELLARLRGTLSVRAAGAVDTLPMTGSFSGGPFEVEGRPKPADWIEMNSQYLSCTPGYLPAMGIRILGGRDFNERDTRTSQPVALINEPLALTYFTGDPVGKHVRYRDGWRTVVGIVAPVKQFQRSRPAGPQIYVPAAQTLPGALWFTVRTSGDPRTLAGAARDIVRQMDPDLPVLRLGTMEDVQEQSLHDERLLSCLLGAFAGFALLIAALGIYGVIAWSVARRTHEIGVRLALGATRGSVVATVLRNGVALAGAGVLAGLPLSLGAGKVLENLLYGVSPRDVTVLSATPVILMGAAILSSLLPARRAARLDPTAALRVE